MKKSFAQHEPKKREGALAPLFERLVDFDTDALQEPFVQKFYDSEEVKDSIERELLHLLGTKAKIRKEDYLALAKDPLNYALPFMYGTPDFSYFEGTNTEQWQPFSKYVAKAIEAFEPRLSNIGVRVIGVDNQKQFLDIEINAMINFCGFFEEATFAIKMKAA